MYDVWRSCKQNQFLIDGFPRNISNATAWFQAMSNIAIVDMVLTLDCTEEIIKERILRRSKTSGRSDDNMTTLLKRFSVLTPFYSSTFLLFRSHNFTSLNIADRTMTF